MLDTDRTLEWERTHVQLLEKERHLQQLTVRRARGEIAHEQFTRLQAEAARLRHSADEMFNAVFRFYES